ncbi:MAG: hypothetical protein CUN55_21270, partial [Phototrophicales bacterium]
LRRSVFLRLDALMYGVIAAYVYRYRADLFFSKVAPLAVIGVAVSILGIYMNAMVREHNVRLFAALGFPIASIGFTFLLPTLMTLRGKDSAIHLAITKISLWSYS